MSTLKKLMGIFIEIPNETAKPAQTIESTPINATEIQQNVPVANLEEYQKSLEQFLEEKNQPGVDYFEFQKILSNQEQLNLPEETLYKVAWSSLIAIDSKITPLVLTSSAEKYLAELSNNAKEFSAEISNEINSVKILNENSINQLQKENLDAQEKIKNLKSEIEKLESIINSNNSSLKDLNKEVFDKEYQYKEIERNFNTAYELFINRIKNHIIKIQNYLK